MQMLLKIQLILDLDIIATCVAVKLREKCQYKVCGNIGNVFIAMYVKCLRQSEGVMLAIEFAKIFILLVILIMLVRIAIILETNSDEMNKRWRK